MTNDLKTMNRKQLEKLRKTVDQALAKLRTQEMKVARKAAAKAAAAHGFSLEELTSGASPVTGKTKAKKPKAPSVAKYANPADATQTWSGKGRQPQWFKDAMDAGTTPESLEI